MYSPPSPGPSSHRRRPAAPAIQASASHNTPIASGLTQILRRRRSGGALASTTAQTPAVVPALPQPASLPAISAMAAARSPSQTHRIRLVPHIDNRRSLRFDPITRDVTEGAPAMRIGRFTDRSGLGVAAANAALGSNKLAFKSKVVSRAHAEVWCEHPAKFFIKDTKSSSGTFLNHVRLSAANQESRPFELKDGDTLQLGVDYQGGTEDIYKCVRIRVEIGREWQATPNAFNTNAFRQLKALATPNLPVVVAPGEKKPVKSGFADCCICLFSVTIQQSLFIAPCSHAFHYKCIRPLLERDYPAFSCPLCRTFADLEEDVEVDGASLDLDHDADGAAGDVLHSDDAGDAELLAPNLTRDPGAETEVEADGPVRRHAPRAPSGSGIQDFLMPGGHGIVDLAEASDDDVEMMEALDEPPLPPLPEGSPIPMDGPALRSRSGSIESGFAGQGRSEDDASGEGAASGEGEEADRAAKRKR
ncbi:SMAD/FHA domain-containing protein [Artomyces pyxidatus]|uniref:SMAD/FHA domain-containing protein n=1 Tax=Artomyces pyxidatus TaxID=48021 RepID=A0ACB8TF72_9AGAM|nr:SMAD/FHA domain-containing protein [Artomyces pyxidatus]